MPAYSECPLCHSDKFKTSADPKLNTKIQALLIFCPNNNAGCRWVGKLSQLALHCNGDAGCPFQKVKCPSNCGRLLHRQNVAEHLLTECPCYCQYCKVTASEELIASQHKENCSKYTQQCPNKCGLKILHGNIPEHRKLCPLQEIKCEYYSLGCKVTMLRKDKEEHHKNSLIKHLDLIQHKISDKNKIKSYWIKVSYPILVVILIAILSQFHYMNVSKCEDLRAEYDDLSTNLAHMQVENEKLQKHVNNIEGHTKTWTKQYVDDAIHDLKDEISNIDDNVDDINEENNNLKKYFHTLQNKFVALEIKSIYYVEMANLMTSKLLDNFKSIEKNVMNIFNRSNAVYTEVRDY